MAIVYRTPAANMSGWTDIVKQYAVAAGQAVGGKALKAAEKKLGIVKPAAAVQQQPAGGAGGGGAKKSGPNMLLIGGALAAVAGIGYMLMRKKSAA